MAEPCPQEERVRGDASRRRPSLPADSPRHALPRRRPQRSGRRLWLSARDGLEALSSTLTRPRRPFARSSRTDPIPPRLCSASSGCMRRCFPSSGDRTYRSGGRGRCSSPTRVRAHYRSAGARLEADLALRTELAVSKVCAREGSAKRSALDARRRSHCLLLVLLLARSRRRSGKGRLTSSRRGAGTRGRAALLVRVVRWPSSLCQVQESVTVALARRNEAARRTVTPSGARGDEVGASSTRARERA